MTLKPRRYSKAANLTEGKERMNNRHSYGTALLNQVEILIMDTLESEGSLYGYQVATKTGLTVQEAGRSKRYDLAHMMLSRLEAKGFVRQVEGSARRELTERGLAFLLTGE